MREKSLLTSLILLVMLCLVLFCHSTYAQETPVASNDSGTKQPPSNAVAANPSIEVPAFSQLSVSTGVNVAGPSNVGATSAGIPIEVPPGRNGIAPNLALVYNSSMGNGIVGVGWSIGLGEIQRSTKRGVNYGGNDFVFLINGSSDELVARGDLGPNYYGEKIERSFSKYYYNGSGWVVTTKDGTKYYYGVDPNANSKQENAYGVFKWCLDRVEDTNGNYMTVAYWKDIPNGEIYLDRIDYTGNFGLSATNHVQFIYDSGLRPDAPPMFTSNAEVRTAYLLVRVEVVANGQLSRKYVLNYHDSNSSTLRSLLSSVTQYGYDGVTYLPPINLTYQEDSAGWNAQWWGNGPSVGTPIGNNCTAGDFNGDGKTDLLCYPGSGSDWHVGLSTGSGWNAQWWGNGPSVGTPIGNNCTAGDYNGDGKTDLLCYPGSGPNWYVALSTGSGWNAQWWGNGPSVGTPIGNNCMAGDYNGDSMVDLLCYPGSGPNWHVALSMSRSPDLLSSVQNSVGGTTTINYTPSSAYQNTNLPFIVQAVSSITVNDANGNVSTTNYTYSGGFFSAAEREFRGFSYVRATDSVGYTETWYYQDDIFKGIANAQGTSDASGYLWFGTASDFQYTQPYTGVVFPFVNFTDNYIVDGLSTLQQLLDGTATYKKTRTSFTYDSYGNITRKYSFGDVAVSGDERDEYTEFTYDLLKWMFLPSHTYINDSGGTKRAETWFSYDTNRGNLLTKTAWNNEGVNPVISYSYNSYGNQTSVTDARGYPTFTDYDSTYTYPARVTNYLGHQASKAYDYRFGKPLTETDLNGNTTLYTYDPFGRIKTVTAPDDGVPAYAWKETYYDGLGRTVRARTGGPDGKFIAQQTVYDQRGQVEYASLPYFESVETARWTRYYHDPIGRVTDVQNPDGTVVSKRYMQGRTTIIDANDHVKVEEKDAYGRLTKVEEYTGTDPNVTIYATTRYVYNVLGSLTDVYDAQNNNTHIQYDSLSRKVSMDDPDMGHWEYAYDANGNLIWQEDAKNQIIQFQYDPLNRITLKDYPSGTDVTYAYDEAFSSYSKGRPTTVTDASGTEKYYYDRSGKPRATIKTVDGVNYQIDSTYDELGRTVSIRYPDNETVSYGYDTGGNLTVAGGYATYNGFNALGQAGSVNYGNNVSTTLQYYSSNNRLLSIATNSPTQGGIQNLSYIFDNAGNISTITDLLDGSRTQTFTYDDLNRLTQAQSASYANGTITYQYNQLGNMTYNSRVGSYTYGTKPHAVLQAGSNSYSYDANGNMQTRNGGTITYDYDNRVTNIGSVTSVYDYAGHRVKKNGTVYIGKLYECLGTTCTKYIFAGSSRIASKSSSYTYYYHTDHLGSTSIITDLSGNKVQETYYYPFGETRYDSGSATHYKFTGQEEDAETGLYYYGARYYDPVIGRFISADSVVPDFSDPQMLNRFTYADNNPLSYTDPTGHFPFLALIAIGAFIGGASAAISGGNFGDILRGMVMGAVSAGMGFGVGAVAAPAGAIVSGAVGGATAGLIASGPSGKVGQGMLIGAITGGIAGGIGSIPFEDAYLEGLVQITTGTVVGGVASELTGGKFSQGAFMGAGAAAVAWGLSRAMTGRESMEKAEIDMTTNHSDVPTSSEYQQLAANYDEYKGTGFRKAPEGDPMQKVLPKNYKPQGINNLPGQAIETAPSTPTWKRVFDILFRVLKGVSRTPVIIVPNPAIIDYYNDPYGNVT